ncbi:AAA family ATPase [Nocardia sp. NPDC056541]|uniref:AAA family ATPase n=1 Tax=Nocardia sp. NPDC056541 TaxID=3345860 RepID=UPI00366AA708
MSETTVAMRRTIDNRDASIMASHFGRMFRADGLLVASFGKTPGAIREYPNTREGHERLYADATKAQAGGHSSFFNGGVWSEVGPTLSGRTATPAPEQHVLWVDIDADKNPDWDLLKRLQRKGCLIINSGSPGNQHVWFIIEDAMDPDTWQEMNTTLTRAVGADAKQDRHSWLRLPYMRSYKPVHGPEGRPVRIRDVGEGAWGLDEFKKAIGYTGRTAPGRATRRNDADTAPIARETAKQRALPAAVRRVLVAEYDDRSDKWWKFWRECAEHGVSKKQALAHTLDGEDLPAKWTEASITKQIHKAYVEGTGRPEPSAQTKKRRKSTDMNRPSGGLTIRRASSVKIKKLFWLWQDRIPLGALSLLGGREGTGKSSVAYGIAADVTHGRLSDGYYDGQPKNVIVCATEDAWDTTIVPRLHAAGADLDRILFFEAEDEQLMLPNDNEAFADAVREYEVGLVIFDPIVSVLDDVVDVDKGRDLRKALEPINRLAAEADCAFLGIAHFNKRTEGDMGMLLSGSLVWSQVARATLGLMADPDDENGFFFFNGKNNNAPGDVPVLKGHTEARFVPTDDGDETRTSVAVWDGEAEVTRRQLLGIASKSAGNGSPVDQWLTEQIINGPVAATEIFERGKARGYTEDRLRRARKRIGAEMFREGFGKGGVFMWRIPEA